MEKPYLGFMLSAFLMLLIFFPIANTDYAFLDEAHQLWHNRDGSDYSMFFVQGRWLTGVFLNYAYAQCQTIAQVKILRIVSFLSWMLFLFEYFRLAHRWQKEIGFSNFLLLAGGVYIACAPSLAVYIGWAACFEVGIAHLLGLWSGHLFFVKFTAPGKKFQYFDWKTVGIISCSLACLFLYQTAFGLFLLPFVFYLIGKRATLSSRLIRIAIGGYLALSALYYLFFHLSLKFSAYQPSDRTHITIDIPGKLGFFFSAPLSQAFSFNFLYDMHGIFSQALPIVVMIGWVAGTWFLDKTRPLRQLAFISGFIGICILIYAPLMIARENFSSYRTMFMLNFSVTLMLLDTVLKLVNNRKPIAVSAFSLLFLVIGYFNFHHNFINPLAKEYQLVRNYFEDHYSENTKIVYFLRPPENLFHKPFGIQTYKDEFGLPSTFKDWVPEPLVRQLILEKTNSRTVAEKVKIIQFVEHSPFEQEKNLNLADALYLDPESLLEKSPVRFR